MKRALLAALALAAGVMLAMAALAASADAPVVSTLAPLMEKELHWGMSHAEVVDVYNRPAGLFDREFAAQIAKLQPGTQMDEVQADRDNRKVNFAHAYAEFQDTPTGYDLTPLKSEYTYDNGEAIQEVFKDGKNRFFFYIKDQLWKIYDQIPLKADGPLGDSYQGALARLGGVLAAPPRVRAAGKQGLANTTADWQDGSTHLRAVDRSGEHLVGIVLEDKRTLANLASLRSNKAADPFALDPSVAALTRGGISDPNAGRQGGDAGTKKHK